MRTFRILALLALPLVLAAGVAPTSPVADAAMRGDLTQVRSLLASGRDVNAPQGDGMTALHWAADRGDLPMVELLLKAKASVRATTRMAGYTPLHIAAKGGHGAIVVALLKAGADPNAMTETGALPLHFAAASGALDGVAALLDKGADPNAREKVYGQTPLIFAASADRAAVITTLIKRGADPTIKTRKINISEETAAEQAAARRRNDVLIGFEPERHRDSSKAPQGGADVPVGAMAPGRGAAAPVGAGSGPYSMRALGFAGLVGDTMPAPGAGRGGRGTIAPPPTPKGPFTPAQMQQAIAEGRKLQASSEATKGPVREVVDTINGGIAGFLNAVGGMGTLTPLLHAVRQGNVAATTALLDAGADINATSDVDHTSPLLMATVNGHFDLAMQLVKRGANPNLINTYGLGPLYAAINTFYAPRSRFPQPQSVQVQQTTHLELMEALIKAGAKVNERLTGQFWYFAYNNCGNANCGLENITGTTPFWRAAYALDVDAMRMLAKAGADVNLPSTPPAPGARGGRGGAGAPGAQPSGAGVDPLIPFDPTGGAGGRGQAPPPGPPLDPEIEAAAKAAPTGLGVFPVHAVAGVGYGNGFAGNSHRHAPDAWMPAMKYVVEELRADVNARDNNGYTPMHHAAARGDNEMILYLVSKGADPKAVAKNGRTTVDMANGPVQRLSPILETIALLEKLGAKNNHRCVSCW